MFHLTFAAISRSTGRSAASACAYVSAEVVADDRTVYRRKTKPSSVDHLVTESLRCYFCGLSDKGHATPEEAK